MFIPFRELLKMAFGPKFRRAYGRYYLLDYLIIGLFLLAVFVFSPKSAAIIIYFYVIITFFSLRTDYSTHVGEKAKGDILFANNCQDAIFNRFFWNFGHHVGHHMKPSLHWTKLPAYEKKLGVVDSEDDVQTVSFNFFGLLLPPFLHWRATRRIES